jgi:hypothetical protein
MLRKLTLPYLAARDLTEPVEESVLQQYRAFRCMYTLVILSSTSALSKAETLDFRCGGPPRAFVLVDTTAKKVTFTVQQGLERIVTQYVDGKYGKTLQSGGGFVALLETPSRQFVKIGDRILEFGAGNAGDSVVLDRQSGRIIYADGHKGECTLIEAKR